MTHALKLLALLPVLGLVPSTAARADDAPPKLTSCRGGAQEAVNHNTRNFPAFVAPAAVFAPIPNTLIPGGASGAGGDSDVYVVTFSAEAAVTVGGFWEAQAQYNIGAGFVNMDPVGPNTFHSGVPAQTHTMTWCNRLLAPGGATFQIVWRKTGAGNGVVDDYLMRVERSN